MPEVILAVSHVWGILTKRRCTCVLVTALVGVLMMLRLKQKLSLCVKQSCKQGGNFLSKKSEVLGELR